MNRLIRLLFFFSFVLVFLLSCRGLSPSRGTIIADHSIMDMIWNGQVPVEAIEDAKSKLRIGYGHTSHGSQITDGMNGLVGFADSNNGSGERFGSSGNIYYDGLFSWSRTGAGDDLLLYEGSGYSDGHLELDCGYGGWDDETRAFLAAYPDTNVIMWSWCGQVNGVNLQSHYFGPMKELENDYPNVTFVYMTGHLEGGADDESSNSLLAANNTIRRYCRENGKVLFDFADIEKYNLSGEYFGDRDVNDECNYDSDGNGSRDANWAIEWQDSHTEESEWYNCGAAHSQPVNANQKAYTVWWLFARLAGWSG